MVVRRAAAGAAAVWRCCRVKRPKEKEYGSELRFIFFSFMLTFVFFSFMLNLASIMYRGDIPDE